MQQIFSTAYNVYSYNIMNMLAVKPLEHTSLDMT